MVLTQSGPCLLLHGSEIVGFWGSIFLLRNERRQQNRAGFDSIRAMRQMVMSSRVRGFLHIPAATRLPASPSRAGRSIWGRTMKQSFASAARLDGRLAMTIVDARRVIGQQRSPSGRGVDYSAVNSVIAHASKISSFNLRQVLQHMRP
jgi:hypothetical protein